MSYGPGNTVHSFIHSVICLTTGPTPLPKWFLHIVRSRASSFKWEHPLLSLRSSTSFLRLLPRLLVTSISPFIFPSITCFRRQFRRKMWPIQLAFRFYNEITFDKKKHTQLHISFSKFSVRFLRNTRRLCSIYRYKFLITEGRIYLIITASLFDSPLFRLRVFSVSLEMKWLCMRNKNLTWS